MLCVYGFTTTRQKGSFIITSCTPSSALLGEFGYPQAQSEHDGKKWDIWRFKQGYSGGAKVGRAAGHAVMDVFTLGLWEVVGTPV